MNMKNDLSFYKYTDEFNDLSDDDKNALYQQLYDVFCCYCEQVLHLERQNTFYHKQYDNIINKLIDRACEKDDY